MNGDKTYYSKILLFGEYGVIYGSMGLAVPLSHYHGMLRFTNLGVNKENDASNKSLAELHSHLFDLDGKNQLNAKLDLEQFDQDIKKGLYFSSNIPQGYGVGSSGALCAAIYDRYCFEKPKLNKENWKNDVADIKEAFVQMESFFHGISSGLDPLVSFLDVPLLIWSLNQVEAIELNIPAGLELFLLNTGRIGKTGPLVESFFNGLRNYSYYKKFKKGFIPSNNETIKAFLEGNTEPFCEYVNELSKFSLDLFENMVPEGLHDLWEKGLSTGDFTLKLCGSGGGGFLLGFTRDFNKVREIIDQYDFELIRWGQQS
jgi:mevalonate kinase